MIGRLLGKLSPLRQHGLRRFNVAALQPDLKAVKIEDIYVGEGHAPFHGLKYTNQLKSYTALKNPFPAFRLVLPNGELSALNHGTVKSTLASDPKKMLHIMETLLISQAMDFLLYNSQRQGRISFYMTSYGEEGCAISSSAALFPHDIIYAQYREPGALLYRGCPISKLMNQVFGNAMDEGKGRQMPVHYGSKEFNFMTISSPLATQLPQAAGAAYALKLENRSKSNLDDQRIVICYFGDGAASEGDFHAALNFAATLECPVLFFCRNNGYAISTPIAEQYRGDGIVSRGPGYGISSYRVDGNDILAVYEAVHTARNEILHENKPILIEAMTYRVGHHSTSDDSAAYRQKDEVDIWTNDNGPLERYKNYLLKQNIITKDMIMEMIEKCQKDVRDAFNRAEQEKKPSVATMFDDVYNNLPDHIRKQKLELENIIRNYPNDFPNIQEYNS